MTAENELPRNVVFQGDSAKVLRMFPDAYFSCVLADPPYGLSQEPDMREVLWNWLHGADSGHEGKGFMGKEWDSFVPGPNVWKQIMRVLKPGGHIFSFSGTRTYDLMVTAMRLAGAEVRDKIDVLCSMTGTLDMVYGSGFPKSLNIEKALLAGGQPELAKQYSGYGSAMKPAHEPIAVFKKGEGPPLPEGSPPFKYTAKASKWERNLGCEHLRWVDGKIVSHEEYMRVWEEDKKRRGEPDFKPHSFMFGNNHPTCKPIDLMRYLVRMCMPPTRGLVLDPFAGSGTTLVAAAIEGHDFVGIDMEETSVLIASERSSFAIQKREWLLGELDKRDKQKSEDESEDEEPE